MASLSAGKAQRGEGAARRSIGAADHAWRTASRQRYATWRPSRGSKRVSSVGDWAGRHCLLQSLAAGLGSLGERRIQPMKTPRATTTLCDCTAPHRGFGSTASGASTMPRSRARSPGIAVDHGGRSCAFLEIENYIGRRRRVAYRQRAMS
jgi:hypothetical protein